MHIVSYSDSDNTGWWTCRYSDLDYIGFKIRIPNILQSTASYKFLLEDAVFLEGVKVLHKTHRINFSNINRLHIEVTLLDRLTNACLYKNFKLSRSFRSIICSLTVTLSLSEFIWRSSVSIIKDLLKFKWS